MLVRLAVVLAVAAGLAVAPALYRRRLRRLQAGPDSHPPVPASLLDGSSRTWLLFTTPWCANCGPVEQRLLASDPDARVVRVDATQQPELAGAFSVRSAPTALLADQDGRVRARLVGMEAVDRYVVTQ
jgi:thiol-disulfide isomerase/thioredoxin